MTAERVGADVEAGAQALFEHFHRNHRYGGDYQWPAPEQHLPWWRDAARAVLATVLAHYESGHECVTKPLCDGWPFGVDDAYRTVAAVAWPAERQENRDGWAVTMRERPDLFEKEAARARERLEAAIAHGRAALRAASYADQPATAPAQCADLSGDVIVADRFDASRIGADQPAETRESAGSETDHG